MEVGHRNFIELKTPDGKLRSFLGDDIAILGVLRQLRNRAVDVIILGLMHESDPYGEYNEVSRRDRATHADNLPETVDIQLPSVPCKEESVDACTMTCLAAPNICDCVAIELTPANLKYVRVAGQALTTEECDECHFDADLNKKSKRRPDEEIITTTTGIKVDYRRKSLYMTWMDPDGRAHKKYIKPVAWTQAEIEKTESLLLRWTMEPSPKKKKTNKGLRPA